MGHGCSTSLFTGMSQRSQQICTQLQIFRGIGCSSPDFSFEKFARLEPIFLVRSSLLALALSPFPFFDQFPKAAALF